jgi:hypothetical protein
MPARANVTTRMRGGASRARGAGEASLERLTHSVEAAQVALKDLRKELSKGTRDVLGDLDVTLKDARKNLRSVSRTVSKDLEEIQQALTAGKPARARTTGPRKRAAAAGTRRATTTGKPATARKRTTTTAKAPTARKRSTTAKTPAARAEKQTGSAGADERDRP